MSSEQFRRFHSLIATRLPRLPIAGSPLPEHGPSTPRVLQECRMELPAFPRSAPATDKTIILMPAYDAARTLERIVTDIPRGCFDEIIVVNDASRDQTVEVATRLPVTLIRHDRNLGYGGNQKTCYREALARGAAYVV